MSVDANWNCTAQKPGPAGVASGPLEQPLTVGEKFVLVCEGDSVNLKKDTLQLELPKSDPFALRILTTQSLDATKGVFTVTSYRAGESEIQGVVLTDGTLRVALNGVRFQVSSVLNPQENPEMKAFAPWEPLAMSWPQWLWLSIAVVVALIAMMIAGTLQKAAQRRRLLQELSRHGSALTPYQQLNKEFRQLARTYPPSQWSAENAAKFIAELDRAFRWYLAREFVIPAHEWRAKAVAKEIRKKERALSKHIDRDLRIAFRELANARPASGKLSTIDAQQIVDLCRKVADQVYHFHKERKTA
jgi:hypothetical protein